MYSGMNAYCYVGFWFSLQTLVINSGVRTCVQKKMKKVFKKVTLGRGSAARGGISGALVKPYISKKCVVLFRREHHLAPWRFPGPLGEGKRDEVNLTP